MNAAREALTRAVNRSIEAGAPLYTNISALPVAALDMIDESARWAIANALRSAAAQWTEWSGSLADPRTAAAFAAQAKEAESYAEQFENC